MTKRLFTSALFAGLAAGALAALMQFTFVVPLLFEGELYETGERVHFAQGWIQSAAGAPIIWSEMPRHFATFAANLVTYTGLALLLVAGFALAERFGRKIDARTGLLWGLSGFLAFNLAPAFGLPPELPGTISPDLIIRQIWWTMTVCGAGLAMALFGYGKGPVPIAIGVGLLVGPHLVGAPHLDTYFGTAPPELASHFVTRSLGVAVAAWCLLGLIAGAIWSRDA
jgi:cobalt transporter subunit CbtA